MCSHLRLSLLSLALGAASLGCAPNPPVRTTDGSVSDDGSKGSDVLQPSDDWPLEEVRDRASTSLCGWLERCGALGRTTVEECASNYRFSNARTFDAYVAAVAAGRLAYDGKKAADCFTQLSSLECNARPSETDDCADYLVGTVPLESPCYASLRNECAEGYCRRAGGECPGKCAAFAEEDEPCGDVSDLRCEDALHCDAESHTCRPRLDEGSTCSDSEDCEEGLACVVLGAGRKSCRRRLPLGADCSPYDACASGLCSGGSCREHVALGEECNAHVQCGEGRLCAAATGGLPYLVCFALESPGARCAVDWQCEAGLYCPSGTCASLGDEGESCVLSRECRTGLFCNPTSNTCTPLSDAGGPCDVLLYPACAKADAYCDVASSTCERKLANGEPCTESVQCRSGECGPSKKCRAAGGACDGL